MTGAARTTLRTKAGALTVLVARGVPADAATALARRLAEEGARALGPAPRDAGVEAWVKAAPLSPSGARRHGLARYAGRAAPMVREFRHLGWLDARLFRVPRPLFCATLTRGLRLRHQLLATAPLADARPFDAALADADGATRRALAEEFGRELGRLHALGFLHADVYPRNVLVTPPPRGSSDTRRLAWIDCWAGGPGRGDRALARPLARDLGTWFAHATELWDDDEARAALAEYSAARAANGRPLRRPARFLARVVAERRRELRRLQREPDRLRGAPFPRAGWAAPGPETWRR